MSIHESRIPYHFHQIHRHLDINWAITAESSSLHIASNWTQTGTFGFQVQVANHYAMHRFNWLLAIILNYDSC